MTYRKEVWNNHLIIITLCLNLIIIRQPTYFRIARGWHPTITTKHSVSVQRDQFAFLALSSLVEETVASLFWA